MSLHTDIQLRAAYSAQMLGLWRTDQAKVEDEDISRPGCESSMCVGGCATVCDGDGTGHIVLLIGAVGVSALGTMLQWNIVSKMSP